MKGIQITAGFLLAGGAQCDHLWNLNKDPTESTDLFNDASYDDIKKELTDRLSYWQELLVVDDDSDTTDDDTIKMEAFEACGGICPYLDDTYSRSIEQIYFPSDPPNVIFVLVDDLGWNDIGFRSTYMNWTTPTIDRLATEGIILENYFTLYSCAPSRSSLMTGRFAGRFGMLNDLDGSLALPLSEVTFAEEMQSAGYETHMVGKWDLGYASKSRLPTYRGFDSFYGYYLSSMDYYTKESDSLGLLDLHHGVDLVTDEYELSDTYHSGFLFQQKVEEIIRDYATNSSSKPLFLYYAMQLVHDPFQSPTQYSERCTDLSSTTATEDDYNHCGMNLMLDEAIANLTCVLDEYDMLSNTVFILASDNGGPAEITGNSVPFRGHKLYLNRGGISANAFITSSLIPEDRRGTFYAGQMHVTDWLPTVMSLVTNGEWTGGYTGNEIDGVDMWGALLNNETSPRSEIVHYVNELGKGSIQISMMKLDVNEVPQAYDNVTDYFPTDLAPGEARTLCASPYLAADDDDSTASTTSAPSEETEAPTEEDAESSESSIGEHVDPPVNAAMQRGLRERSSVRSASSGGIRSSSALSASHNYVGTTTTTASVAKAGRDERSFAEIQIETSPAGRAAVQLDGAVGDGVFASVASFVNDVSLLSGGLIAVIVVVGFAAQRIHTSVFSCTV